MDRLLVSPQKGCNNQAQPVDPILLHMTLLSSFDQEEMGVKHSYIHASGESGSSNISYCWCLLSIFHGTFSISRCRGSIHGQRLSDYRNNCTDSINKRTNYLDNSLPLRVSYCFSCTTSSPVRGYFLNCL